MTELTSVQMMAGPFTYNNEEWLTHFKKQSTTINSLANRLAAVLPTTLADKDGETYRAEVEKTKAAKVAKHKAKRRRGRTAKHETITVKNNGKWEKCLG